MKKNWVEIKMVDACEILTCGVASTPTYVDERIGIPFLSAQNVRDGDVVLDKYNFISKEFHQKLTNKNKPSKGDILYSRVGAKYGEAGVVEHDFEFSIYVSVTLIRPKKELLDNYYLKNYLNSPRIKELAKKSISSSGVPNLNVNSVREFLIPLPPLPEQQRIVAILDETFAAIAKAKANAQQNLKNAKELFESYLQGVFENKGEGWEEKEFGSIIEVLTDYHANGSYQVLKANVLLKEVEDYAWMVRSTDFENDFENDFRYIDEHGYNFLNKSKVYGGEIIMSKIGNAGNVYLMPNIDRPCSLAMNLFLIRLDEKKAVPHFVLQYLKSYSGEFQIKSRLQGATTKTITKDNVRNIIIPLPPLKTQQAIVQKLDALSAETKKLENIYHQKLNDLEELKKSVLQKAFAGELKTSSVVL